MFVVKIGENHLMKVSKCETSRKTHSGVIL